MAPSVAGDGGGAPSPGVSSRSSPLASSEHLTLPRTFTCLYYMQRGTQSTFVSQPSLTPPCLESLRQRGCPLCLRSLKRTAGEPPVSASHPHRRSPRRVELDAVPVPAVRSPRTLPGGHLGSVPSQWERPGCCQVSTAWGGRAGRGTWTHLSPPPSTPPARPVSALRLAQMRGTCSILSQISPKLSTAPGSAPQHIFITLPPGHSGSWLVLSAAPGVRGWRERGKGCPCLPPRPPLG